MEEIVRPPSDHQRHAQRQAPRGMPRRSPRPATPLEHSLTPGESEEREPDAPAPLEHYEELDVLGSGGAGVVVLARDRRTGQRVAIKRLLRQSPSLLSSFRREAKTIASLDHPGIVGLLDVLEVGPEELALVLELVEGPSLESLARADGRLGLEHALRLTREIAEALAYAHAQGVVHRDVKPTNILIAADGRPKLVDFGLALPLETLQSLTPSAKGPCGTLDYMAPEQWQQADRVDGRADVYSLGATLYRMLTGNSPRVIRERRIPEPVRELVLNCVEEFPGDRTSSMQELIGELDRLLAGTFEDESGVHAPLAAVSERLERDLQETGGRTRSRRLVVAASGLVAMGALPPGSDGRISARLRVGAPLEDELDALVSTILAEVSGPDRARLLRDAHAVLAAAVSRRVDPSGQHALRRLVDASVQGARRGASDRLTDAVARFARHGFLTAADVSRLAADPGSPVHVLNGVLQCLRRHAHASASPAEWQINASRWRHALQELAAALPDAELAPQIDAELLAVRLEVMAREQAGD